MENIYNEVFNELEGEIGEVLEDIAKSFKNVKPFQKRLITPKERIATYDNLTPQQQDQLITQYGPKAFNDYVEQMETEKLRRGWP